MFIIEDHTVTVKQQRKSQRCSITLICDYVLHWTAWYVHLDPYAFLLKFVFKD